MFLGQSVCFSPTSETKLLSLFYVTSTWASWLFQAHELAFQNVFDTIKAFE
jgi:hypothetical protein